MFGYFLILMLGLSFLMVALGLLIFVWGPFLLEECD